jgi:cytochrome c oxidase subunit II
VGPDLDKVLASQNEAFIKQSIVDPNAVIAKGFQKGIMPTTFASQIKAPDLDALVKYLYTVTHK